MATSTTMKPYTLSQLRSSGWQSKTVKQEIHDNFLAKLLSPIERVLGTTLLATTTAQRIKFFNDANVGVVLMLRHPIGFDQHFGMNVSIDGCHQRLLCG